MLKPELSHLRNFVVALFVMFVSAGGGLIQSQEPEKLLPLAEETELFNGTDLNGWLFFTKNDTVKVEDVWTVADGVLKCTGKPAG